LTPPIQESERRKKLIQELEESNDFELVDVNVEEGSFTLIEPGALDGTTRGILSSSPGSTSAEPAKWLVNLSIGDFNGGKTCTCQIATVKKRQISLLLYYPHPSCLTSLFSFCRKNFVIIYMAVIIAALPLNMFLKPALEEVGCNEFGAFFITTMCVVSCLNFVVCPILSKVFRRFLTPWSIKQLDWLVEVTILLLLLLMILLVIFLLLLHCNDYCYCNNCHSHTKSLPGDELIVNALLSCPHDWPV